MNKSIQQKMAQYKKIAISHAGNAAPLNSVNNRDDSLSKVIRSQKEADDFMADVESAFKRVK